MGQERMKDLLEESYEEEIMESDLADEEEELSEEEYDDRAYEFDQYVANRLELEEGLLNVFIEPSVQNGEGGLFIFYDNCEGDTPVVDFATADEYIYNNDKEGYYNYILSAIK